MKTKKIMAPDLYSERLFFRDINESDTDFIVKLRANPDIYQYFVSPHEITKEEHLHWYVNHYIYDENRFDWIAFSNIGEPIGIFGVKRENGSSYIAEVSYILTPKHYKKGYASEAIERLILFCKNEWHCHAVIADIHRDNAQSLRFAERLGFQKISEYDSFLRYERYL